MRPEIELNGCYYYRPSAWISADGEDASDFLQSQFSNDLSKLGSGDVSYGLWLDQKGKVCGDSFVVRRSEEGFNLMSYATPEALILEKLNGFIVADDVELEGQASEVVGLTLIGKALDLASDFGIFPNRSGLVSFANETVFVIPGRRGNQPSLELILPEEGRNLLVELLSKRQPDLVKLEKASMEATRILSREPSIPLDLGPGELPQEGGLEVDAVSFNKGCYLGQEVMSRLHSMGKVRRSLRIIRSGQPLDYGSDVFADSKKVGVVKTSIRFQEAYFALALLSNSVSGSSLLVSGTPAGEIPLILIPE